MTWNVEKHVRYRGAVDMKEQKKTERIKYALKKEYKVKT